MEAEFAAFLDRVETEAPSEGLGPDITPAAARIVDTVFELLEEELARYDNSARESPARGVRPRRWAGEVPR